MARQQQAKCLELRAVMSLSRLLQAQGKRAEAYQLLAESYAWFTEGFETPELQAAKALLETFCSCEATGLWVVKEREPCSAQEWSIRERLAMSHAAPDAQLANAPRHVCIPKLLADHAERIPRRWPFSPPGVHRSPMDVYISMLAT